ncbi:MAG: hypothetical protein A3F43_01255 [Gammaproteobacteria bacterium RIFCSPHIGHO2_12_FULL_42_10]|nr:MAG: hypothetical protein A3F43_01255 [Gammaproteobacteria bacterium RIFCSPHIGHO2_12_FULL_42_10]
MHTKWTKIVFIIGIFTGPWSGSPANSTTSPDQSSCILLGPTPSFIVKLHAVPPTFIAQRQLTHEFLKAITSPNILFTRSKRMSRGLYLVYFKEIIPLVKKNHVESGCYSQKALATMISKIKQSPFVSDVTPNFLSSIMEASADAPTQWNLKTPPGGIDAETTWINFTMGSPRVTIAVLDTGIMDHDALNANILPGVHFTNAGDAGLSASPSCIECSGYDHGTLVAGIIASTGEAAYGHTLFGVAPSSTILPINVFTQFTDQKTCGFPPCIYSYLSDQINALNWLAGDDFFELPPPSTVVGINMSLGNLAPCPGGAQNAFHRLQNQEISIVVAAGNQNTDSARDYPANCKGVISVAATGYYGERASYSNWGKSVTIAAPGGNGQYSIYSTVHNNYVYRQGTSLATPHVSGIIALLYVIDPALNVDKVGKIITSSETVTPFPSSEVLPAGLSACMNNRSDKSCGAGIINAYKSAQKAYLLASDH